jgi:hypothetical protein
MNPVTDLLYELYRKIFKFVFNVLWWNQTVRKMGDELYPDVVPSVGSITGVVENFKNEVKWMKEHKVSRWAWFDYICGIGRGVLLIAVLLTLLVIEIIYVAPRGIR